MGTEEFKRVWLEQTQRPGTKLGRGKPRASPEEDLQRATHQWVELNTPRHPILRWMFHAPSGGKRPPGEAGKLKAMGVKKGVADWICPFPSAAARGLAIELKAPNGKPTPEQIAFLQLAQSNGWICAVCTTLDEFVKTTEQFLSKD